MLTRQQFFKLAQIQTTVATFVTLLFGAAYAGYHYHIFNPYLSFLAVLVVMFFLIGVNVRDHYVDYVVASNKGSPLARHMVIGQENLRLKNVRLVYLIFWGLAALIGVYLITQTTLLALYGALICFVLGILYAAGPLPLSSTPFGEVVTGVAMGFGPFFATFYMNVFADIQWSFLIIGSLVIASLPTTIIAINIVLANNICDVEEDVEDGRLTLPYYLGLEKSLLLFNTLYYVAYVAVIVSVYFGLYPSSSLLMLLSFPLVYKNMRLFRNDQNKERGLRLAAVSAVVIAVSLLGSFLIGLLV